MGVRFGQVMTDKTPAIALMFPGQGSQYSGMAKQLSENFRYTNPIFEEASDAIKERLLNLCLDGSEDELRLTRNAQPCILVCSYAWFVVLKKELGLVVHSGCGHSLGEYTSLLASGAIELASAVSLVQKRGEFMQEAVPLGFGKMAAVLGLDDEKVERVCDLATESEHSLVVPANYNAPNQVVIAGHAGAVDRARAIVLGSRPELRARKFIELNVSAPFHSPLMKSAKARFIPFLEAIAWKKFGFPIVFNVDAEYRHEADCKALLMDQMDHPVLFTACVRTLKAEGGTHFIEPGPSKVLTGLGKRILDEAVFFSVDSAEELKNLEKALQEIKK